MEFVCFVWISEQIANFAFYTTLKDWFLYPRRSVFTARYAQSPHMTHMFVFDVHVTVHRDKFRIIKLTRCTNISNLFLE